MQIATILISIHGKRLFSKLLFRSFFECKIDKVQDINVINFGTRKKVRAVVATVIDKYCWHRMKRCFGSC